MAIGPLSVSDFVVVDVSVSAPAQAALQFNQGLIVGPSTVIPSYGANPRLRQYSSLAEMLADGFTNEDPEYLAAELYFSAESAPGFVWIGRQDLTAIETAEPDGRTVFDGAMSSSVNPTYLNSATADFVSGDVGAAVRVIGAGVAGADLISTIASVTSTTVAVLNDAASTTVSAAQTSIGSVGNGYAAGDRVVPSTGGTNATLTVLTVGTSGVVLTLGTTIGSQGTGFTVENGLTTTTSGAGTGLEVNVTAVGETYLEAVETCYLANSTDWYGFMCCNATDDDHLALAEYSTANWEFVLYFGSTADVGVEYGTADNICLQMKALQYKALMVFATTQSGLYPNNIYAAGAVLGEYAGLNSGLANSYFTLNLKSIVGVGPEPITQSQYNAIVGANCNVVADFGPYDGYLSRGILSSGDYFDQILFRAMLVNNIQVNLMNLLTSVPAVPQTDPGEHQLIAQVDAACAYLASIGYIAAGIWQGRPILNLQTGQPLPLGYLDQAQSYAYQSAGDRAARKAQPIYCAYLEAGAVHSVLVQVNVEV